MSTRAEPSERSLTVVTPWSWLLGLMAAAVMSCALAAAPSGPEAQFTEAVTQLRNGKTGEALATLETLTQRQPNFHLAQLFYGELLAALSGAGPNAISPEALSSPRLNDLAEEARVRLAGEMALPAPGLVPDALLQLSAEFEHAIVVDLPRARLYLLKNQGGTLSLQRNNYAAMGRNGAGKQTAGDLRTPIGIYHVTQWIDDQQLPELYGAGAFPLDYPNAWDLTKHRSGSGIWLHGVPRDTYSRAPRSSEGCVTMANADLTALRPYVQLGQTPVILSDGIQWVPADAVKTERDEFLARIERWRKRWMARDTEAYLAFYAPDFSVEGMDRAAFAAHKRRVNAQKKYIDIQLSDISLYRYPGTDDQVQVAEFTMAYRSDNYSSTSHKQQFWRRNGDGTWQIVREENR